VPENARVVVLISRLGIVILDAKSQIILKRETLEMREPILEPSGSVSRFENDHHVSNYPRASFLVGTETVLIREEVTAVRFQHETFDGHTRKTWILTWNPAAVVFIGGPAHGDKSDHEERKSKELHFLANSVISLNWVELCQGGARGTACDGNGFAFPGNQMESRVSRLDALVRRGAPSRDYKPFKA
jgi:hypothetical protein